MKCECYSNCSNKKCENKILSLGKFELLVLEEGNLGQGLMLGRIGIDHADTYLGEYSGVVRSNNFNLKKSPPNYTHRLTKRYIVDAENTPNVMKFINHSCTPNLRVEKWFSEGKRPPALVS